MEAETQSSSPGPCRAEASRLGRRLNGHGKPDTSRYDEKRQMTQQKQTHAEIIVIEDDTGLAELTRRAIERKCGLSVLVVSTGADGVHAAMEHPDALLLIDYALPDMSAADVVQALDAKQTTHEFVIITGQGDEQVAVEMMKSGARDYLVKDAAFLDRLPIAVKKVRQDIERDRHLHQQKELTTRVLSILNRDNDISRLITDPLTFSL